MRKKSIAMAFVHLGLCSVQLSQSMQETKFELQRIELPPDQPNPKKRYQRNKFKSINKYHK